MPVISSFIKNKTIFTGENLILRCDVLPLTRGLSFYVTFIKMIMLEDKQTKDLKPLQVEVQVKILKNEGEGNEMK